MPPGGWWSREARRLHLTLLFALPGCLAAGWFELTRAMNGREIAWAYAFEWPLFGVLGTYVWWRLVHDAGPMWRRTTTSHPASEHRDNPDTPDAHSSSALPADPGLEAWQRYLDNLHALDPPGKPPWQQ
jgi:hypothetical protein